MPERIQRSRAKGWRMPDGAVYVGRPTIWGNPFIVGLRTTHGALQAVTDPRFPVTRDRAHAVKRFEKWATIVFTKSDLKALRGKDLACWCPLDEPCHADVLLRLANR